MIVSQGGMVGGLRIGALQGTRRAWQAVGDVVPGHLGRSVTVRPGIRTMMDGHEGGGRTRDWGGVGTQVIVCERVGSAVAGRN